jgi:cyclophilin family peptidyl-prolyl cis-trans isomerase/HEAT repeat protein
MRIRPGRLLPAFGLAVLIGSGACSGPDTDTILLEIRQAEDTRDFAASDLPHHLRSGSKAIRGAAARAIGRIGDPAGQPALVQALRREDVVEVRREIAFGLGILGDARSVPVILDELDQEADAETSAELAIALGRIGDPAAIDALHALLHSSWGIIRERAVEALALIADERSAPLLMDVLDDEDPGVAWRAAWALEKIPGSEQVDALIAATRESDPMLRKAAARSLGRLEAAEAVAPLCELASEVQDDWQLDVQIADALGRIGVVDATSTRTLANLLESSNFHVKVAALQAIGKASVRDLLPRVLDLRGDPAVDVRVEAYAATADCLDGRTLELLRPGLNDTSPAVAATCLARLGESQEEEALGILLAAVDDGSSEVRRLGAAQGLAADPARVGVQRWIELLRGPDPYVATIAATALGELGDPLALDPLEEVLHRPGPASMDMRIEAATALGLIGEDSATETLRAVLEDEADPRLRIAARTSLLELLPPGQALTLPEEDEIRSEVHPVSRSPKQPELVVRSTATQLVLETDRGRIVIDLFGEDAPQMVESFARLAESGFFDGLDFHRVVGDFVIQGGDPTGTGWGDAGYTLRSEWNPRRYQRGVVGIAHSGKDTGSCQLFITQSPQPHLDARYTIWGEVVMGMDVVDEIQRGDRFRATIQRGEPGR